MKAYSRGRIISYASLKKKSANGKITELEFELKILEISYSQTKDSSTLNRIITTEYYQINYMIRKQSVPYKNQPDIVKNG